MKYNLPMTVQDFINAKKLNHRPLPLLLVISISFILWMLFYPAYMSADSLVQYQQALAGSYEDWHPPVMAIFMHYILLLGGGISLVTLLQTLAGCLGVYLLAKEILRQKNIPIQKQTWAPFYILMILILPVSPLPFYLMIFLKDTWILIGLIWIVFIGLRIYKIGHKSSKAYVLHYIILALLMALVFITRYNAIVLMPVFFILLFYNSKRLSKKGESIIPVVFWSILPLFLSIAARKQLNGSFPIKKMYPEHQVMALESVGALIQNPENGNYVPYVKSNLSPNYKEAYYPGNVASVMNWAGSQKTLNQQTFVITDQRIKKEYTDLVVHAPFTLINVKLQGFYNMIKPSTGKYWFHGQLDENPYGLVQNETFKKIRLGWQRLANNIHGIFLLNFISGEHIVWLIVNIALLVFFFLKKQMHCILFIILLVPLGYYFSYMLACTGDDFRFMYPATLLVQIVSLSLLFSKNKSEHSKIISTET